MTGLKLPFWGLNFVEFWCWGLIFGDQGGPGPRAPPPGSAPGRVIILQHSYHACSILHVLTCAVVLIYPPRCPFAGSVTGYSLSLHVNLSTALKPTPTTTTITAYRAIGNSTVYKK